MSLRRWRMPRSVNTILNVAISRASPQFNGYASSDYRDVIRILRKSRLPPSTNSLPFYERLLHEREATWSKTDRGTPIRPAINVSRRRAENRAEPAPHRSSSGLVATIPDSSVKLSSPLTFPRPTGATRKQIHDSRFDAVSWYDDRHECRPGH